MFQGSTHVAKAEHIALVQAAGGTMNGSTWLDRTNYYETLPSHQLELALWLEADRMATLPDALSQENLDNQREVVKNEKRSSYDNRPYGSWQEKLQGHLFPPEHPYHHSTIGSMADLDAASLEDVISFFRTYYAPNNAVLSIVGDVETAAARAAAERYFGAIPANPSIPPLGDLSLPPTLGGERRETVRDRVPLPRIYVAFRAPVYGDPRLDALDIAGQILAGGKGSRLDRRLVRDERIAQDVALFSLGFIGGGSICAGWATVRPGRRRRPRRGGVPRGARAARRPSRSPTTSWPGRTRSSRPTSSAPCSASRSGPTGSRCTRRSSTTRTSSTRCCRATWRSRRRPSAPSAADVFRADNRLVLTYLPEGPAADDAALDADGTTPRRGGGGMSATHRPHAASATATSSPSGPSPGTPRPYDFPTVAEHRLDNGLRILVADLPGRPARLGVARARRTAPPTSRPTEAGATVLAARALSEGTEHYDAIALIEASERLGASLHAEAGWDAFSAGVDVPADRLPAGAGPARRAPAAADVPGGRGRAAARRAAQRHPPGQGRPAPARRGDLHRHHLRPELAVPPPGGRDPGDRRAARPRTSSGARGRAGLDPARATLVVGGDLTGLDVAGDRPSACSATGPRGPGVRPRPADRRHAIGGRAARPRRPSARARSRPRSASGIAGCRAGSPTSTRVSVMGAILGGLFNSRLNMKLREEKGYTYGAGAGFDLRRGAGPVRGPGRGQHRGHGPGHPRHARRADADARDDRHATRSSPRPATSSSASSRSGSRRPRRSSGRSAGSSSTACRSTSWSATATRIEAVDIAAVAQAAARPPRRRATPRSCSSATSTRSGRRSRPRASAASSSSPTTSSGAAGPPLAAAAVDAEPDERSEAVDAERRDRPDRRRRGRRRCPARRTSRRPPTPIRPAEAA